MDLPDADDVESVAELLGIIEAQQAQLDRLEARVEDLEQADPSQSEQSNGPGHPGLDHRDQSVIDQLTTGRRYKPFKILRLYQRHTDIQSDTTAKKRAKNLTAIAFDGRTFVGVETDADGGERQ